MILLLLFATICFVLLIIPLISRMTGKQFERRRQSWRSAYAEAEEDEGLELQDYVENTLPQRTKNTASDNPYEPPEIER